MELFSDFNAYRAIGPYIPILILFLASLVFAAGTLVAALLVRPHKPGEEKLQPYECGLEPATPDARGTYNIRYFIIAVLFIIFDVEVVFLFPWAVVFNKIKLFGFIEMMLFIVILLVGYFYCWKKGALEWV